jgi:ubiquinol-cytochrome c reductase cytochrome b subunit
LTHYRRGAILLDPYGPRHEASAFEVISMRLWDWVEHRTGVAALLRKLLYEDIPGGAKWRYVWGSVLFFLFITQVLTGGLMMTVYAPSATTAWSSVWYIQTEMTLGWLIRGLHHFAAQALVVLMPVHVLQVLIAKAYRAPREFNWWIGVGLFHVVLALALTGYLLPWDQKGYWATKVATNIMGLTPVIGEDLQRVVVGGGDYGHLTLTRFFTLHVMVLPGAFVALLAGHVALFRRHGVTADPRDAQKPTGHFWPEQLLMDSLACLAVLLALVTVAWYAHDIAGSALLDAPADPTSTDYPARPEWYFLCLFQMLKYFEGPALEVVGAIVVPGAIVTLVMLFPLLHHVLSKRTAHRLVMGVSSAILAGIVALTGLAWLDDRNPTDEAVAAVTAKLERGDALSDEDGRVLRARTFHDQRAQSDRVARRAFALAAEKGIPPAGPLELLRSDPMLQGPVLFAANCAACHRFQGHDGRGRIPTERATSSDLGGFGSSRWIRGLLADPMDEKYFGLMVREDGSAGHTRMADVVDDLVADHEDADDLPALEAKLDAVSAYLADEAVHPGRFAHVTQDTAEAALAAADDPVLSDEDRRIVTGRAVFNAVCNECHSFQGVRAGTRNGPEFFGYGSVAWIEHMIAAPGADDRYRDRGRESALMPSFRDRLAPEQIRLIAEWLHATAHPAIGDGRGGD